MNCDETRKQLGALYDCELDAATDRAAADHMATCAGCAEAFARLQSLGEFVRKHGRSPAPAGLLSRIEHHAQPATGSPKGLTAWLLPRLAAAGIGALFVGGAWWFLGSPEGLKQTKLSEPIRSYLQAANVTTTLNELERLQSRPENRVLAWGRQEAKKR